MDRLKDLSLEQLQELTSSGWIDWENRSFKIKKGQMFPCNFCKKEISIKNEFHKTVLEWLYADDWQDGSLCMDCRLDILTEVYNRGLKSDAEFEFLWALAGRGILKDGVTREDAKKATCASA
jgi:hypothetical protein